MEYKGVVERNDKIVRAAIGSKKSLEYLVHTLRADVLKHDTLKREVYSCFEFFINVLDFNIFHNASDIFLTFNIFPFLVD